MKIFFKNLLLKISQFLHLSAKPNPARVDPPQAPEPITPVIIDAHPTPKVILGTVDATGSEIKKIKEGIELLNRAMSTASFKQKVLAAKFTETNDLSNQQIYDHLCANPITINVSVYTGSYVDNHFNHTIGYEDEPGTVHINRYFVFSAYEFADNIIHEAEGHSQGFSHYGVMATSVPYVLNDIFEECCAEMGILDAA